MTLGSFLFRIQTKLFVKIADSTSNQINHYPKHIHSSTYSTKKGD